MTIDGYSQAIIPVPFRYPDDLSSQDDNVALDPSVTGGTYKLTIAYTDRSGTQQSFTFMGIPYDATGAYVQNLLQDRLGVGNVTVTGSSQAIGPDFYFINFDGDLTGLPIDVQADSRSLSGTNPVATVTVITQGGNPIIPPALISSLPNSIAAIAGNNSQVRVVINGSAIPQSSSDTGFVLNASDSILRGLVITGFGVGVSVPSPADVGDLIQGNFIGDYLTYPVDPLSGYLSPLRTRSPLSSKETRKRGSCLTRRTPPSAGPTPRTAMSSAAMAPKAS